MFRAELAVVAQVDQQVAHQHDARTHGVRHRGTHAAEVQQVAARLLLAVVHHREDRTGVDPHGIEQPQRHQHRNVDRIGLEVDLAPALGTDTEALADVEYLRLDGEGPEVDSRRDTGLPAQLVLHVGFTHIGRVVGDIDTADHAPLHPRAGPLCGGARRNGCKQKGQYDSAKHHFNS